MAERWIVQMDVIEAEAVNDLLNWWLLFLLRLKQQEYHVTNVTGFEDIKIFKIWKCFKNT